MSKRLEKINGLIRDEVGAIVEQEIDLVGAMLTVLRVDTSPTLEHATVFVSVMPEHRSAPTMKLLKERIYGIQQKLNKRMAFRPVPKIRFELDDTGSRVQRIEKLLKNQ